MTATSHDPSRHEAGVPPWRDVRVLRIAGQVALLVVVGLVVAFLARNFISATSERGLGFGFGFLDRTAGFEISESPVPYTATDTYGKAFLVGLLNTLFVSAVGIVLATLLGIVVGVARLSPNWPLRQTARCGGPGLQVPAGLLRPPPLPGYPHLLSSGSLRRDSRSWRAVLPD